MFVVEALAIPLYCCIVLDASSILTGIPNIYIYIHISHIQVDFFQFNHVLVHLYHLKCH